MKKLILFTAFLVAVTTSRSQTPSPNPFPKTISVSGSAEMEVIPDEIYVNITLREYQKKGADKKELEAIKTQFLESTRAAGLPDSAVSIASFTGYSNYYAFRRRKKDPDLMASITYQVKFSNSKTMDALVDKLDDEATQSFQIVRTSHSKMQSFREQLKIKAIQAAKNKGTYLTEAINEKLGPAITIVEPDESGVRPVPIDNTRLSQANAVNGVFMDMNFKNTITEIDFQKIKLRYEVDVVFALQ